MKIEIIAKNYKLSEKLKEVIEKKLEKFDRYFDEDAIAKVILKEINNAKQVMEVTINFGGGKIMRGEVLSDNMYDNIDLVLPKLERQVRKFRTKLGKKIKQSGFDEGAIYGKEVETTALPELKIARVKTTELRVMEIADAIEEMQMLDHSFYVFVNKANDSVNVVYKRAAGDVGLLDLIY